jgi:hypothetical protein
MMEEDLQDSPELVQTPLVENMVVPPVFKGLTRELDKLAEQPLLGPRTDFPSGRSHSLCERRNIALMM